MLIKMTFYTSLVFKKKNYQSDNCRFNKQVIILKEVSGMKFLYN